MFPEVEMKKVFTYCYPYSYSQVSFENIFKWRDLLNQGEQIMLW
jgi:hypothetical protein